MPAEVIVPDSDRAMYDRFHFASAVKSGNLVVCSGQIGFGADGKVPESAEEEFRNAWRAIERILDHAGLDLSDLIETTSFHVGMPEHMREFAKVRNEVLSEPWPAWTAIGVSALAFPDARVEIRAIAARRDAG